MLPSGETSTAVTAAQGTPPGGLPQSRTVRYGFGRSLMGCEAVWANTAPPAIVIKRGNVNRVIADHHTPTLGAIQSTVGRTAHAHCPVGCSGDSGRLRRRTSHYCRHGRPDPRRSSRKRGDTFGSGV